MTRYELLIRYNEFVRNVSFSTRMCHGISSWFENVDRDIINASDCFPGSDYYFKKMLSASYSHLKYLYSVNKRLEDTDSDGRMTEAIKATKSVIEDILDTAK